MNKDILDGEKALAKGTWVKLICGASNEDLPSIADLCALYATAGVHCVDVAANIAVVHAARQGLDWAESKFGVRPWLMVSLNDGEDVHFRKASFNPSLCPTNCPRPCQRVCPAEAITNDDGINSNLCYGCGRCLPACPIGLIDTKEKKLKLRDCQLLLTEIQPEAVEIHTAPGRSESFEEIISILTKANLQLQRVAVSCGIEGHAINNETLAREFWERHACLKRYGQRPLWQLDGRPMSGDTGIGAAQVAVKLWKNLLPIAPPGPLQIAGGTNSHTIKLITSRQRPQGIAFGGMARTLIKPFLLDAHRQNRTLRDWPEGWNEALTKAKDLVSPWLTN